MLYVLEPHDQEIIVGGVHDPAAPLVSRFAEGRAVAADDIAPDLRVDIECAPDAYPDYFELQQIPIVTDRFIDVLDASGVENIAVYPVPLCEENKRLQGHSILNILGRASALDPLRSKVSKYRRRISRIQHLSIPQDFSSPLKIFRLEELPYVILVSQDLRDALAGLSNVRLLPAEGWNDSHLF
jgi:hypothetical protein